MNECLRFIRLASASPDRGHEVQITSDFMLILPHDNRQIENKAVVAELHGPSGAGDVAQPEWSGAEQNRERKLPRMTVKFVDGQVVFRSPNLRKALPPTPQVGRVRHIVDVVEKP